MVMLTYRTRATKLVVNQKSSQELASTSSPLFSVEERLTKALAGLCSTSELSAMNSHGILTNDEYDQLLVAHMYIDEGSPLFLEA